MQFIALRGERRARERRGSRLPSSERYPYSSTTVYSTRYTVYGTAVPKSILLMRSSYSGTVQYNSPATNTPSPSSLPTVLRCDGAWRYRTVRWYRQYVQLLLEVRSDRSLTVGAGSDHDGTRNMSRAVHLLYLFRYQIGGGMAVTALQYISHGFVSI